MLSTEVPGALGSSRSSLSPLRSARGGRAFGVKICGSVESGQLADIGELTCGHEFVVGPDWSFENGVQNSETQGARNEMVREDKPSVSWNFPLAVEYKSTNIFGWPRLVITVRDDNRNVVGYGSVHVPTRPGRSVKYCKLFAPMTSSILGDVIASATSEYPEFYDSRFTTACLGREALRVVSNGVVKVSFMVRIEGRDDLGYFAGSTETSS